MVSDGTCVGVEGEYLKIDRRDMKSDFSPQDRKAAKTLSAILLAFIVTWTPYRSKLGRYLVIICTLV